MDKGRTIKNIINGNYYIGKLNIVESLGLACMNEIIILRALAECDEGSMNVSSIADKLHTSLPNVSRSLRYLALDGKVEKCVAKGDRRNIFYGITERGLAALKENVERLEAFFFSALSRLSDADLTVYEDLTQKIYNAYYEELADYKAKNKADII